jgi:putative membrane protein
MGGLSMAGLLGGLVSSIIFSLLGVMVFWVSFVAIDRLTPYDLWKEISQDRNVALAIVVGAMSLGICTIIAAAIRG